MATRTNTYFTFVPTSTSEPPENGFASGTQIISAQVNGVTYGAYNFVNSFVNALIENGHSTDGAIYEWKGSNLSSLIKGDIEGWIDYRINNIDHTKITFTNSSYHTTINGTSVLTALSSSSDDKYYSASLGYNNVTLTYEENTTKPTFWSQKLFRMVTDNGTPSLKFSSTNALGSTSTYTIEYPTDIAIGGGLSLNSVQAYICKYSDKPNASDITTFIKAHPTIKVLGCATYGKKNSDSIIYYHNNWFVETNTSDNSIVYCRWDVTSSTSSPSILVKTYMGEDFDKWGLTTGRDEYCEVLYFC